MPARHFDRALVRAVRRSAERSQGDVAATVGVGTSSVAGWEADSPTEPEPEKLPALARALDRGLDDLFPRAGLPDLADLRCDAGLYQYETSEIIGTKSAGPVRGAERGVRRLKDRYVPLLAEAYGVTVDALLAAQERSFGNAVPDADGTTAIPVSIGEKINYLLQHSFPVGQAPGDEEIATGVNTTEGSEVTDAEEIAALRAGQATSASPVVIEGLADFFGVSKLFFASNEDVVRQVVEGLQALSALQHGSLGALAARGLGDEGLPPALIAQINRIAQEFSAVAPGNAQPRHSGTEPETGESAGE
ncbi:helix-turn-helix domain-containing protein [Streptomyces iconiensis]|uniref:Helix-turn-helix transcriptional regulator n=1 Tax=Streptomyces iconiensis TaxID=1384038 RepID=A0ABT7A5H8_9ACTN|nr:helix-turn-helix transcriptional regulator [Streptomyces iconiensis]MDJ1136269.1 helix-turn-helix transcriptional regulator [Streptomyces iconiensis]